MFNTKFDSFAQACKINNLTEAQMLAHLKRYMDNQNYREGYNKRKNALDKAMRDVDLNDPKAIEQLKQLQAKRNSK